MKNLLFKAGLLLLTGLYFIGFIGIQKEEVVPAKVSVFSPMPGGTPDYLSPNKTAFEELLNVEAMIEKLNVDFIDAMYTLTPSTTKDSHNKINALLYSIDTSLAKKLPPTTRKLIKYRRETFESGKQYSMNDGNTIYGVEELIKVSYSENGKDMMDTLRVNFGYVPLIKSFKIISIEINPR